MNKCTSFNYDFYTTLKFKELLDLRAHKWFWNAPKVTCEQEVPKVLWQQNPTVRSHSQSGQHGVVIFVTWILIGCSEKANCMPESKAMLYSLHQRLKNKWRCTWLIPQLSGRWNIFRTIHRQTPPCVTGPHTSSKDLMLIVTEVTRRISLERWQVLTWRTWCCTRATVDGGLWSHFKCVANGNWCHFAKNIHAGVSWCNTWS